MSDIIPSTISPHIDIQSSNQEVQEEFSQLVIEQSLGLQGSAELIGAKNAVLVIMASLLLTDGKSILHNVPNSSDVQQMIVLLQDLGAEINYDAAKKILSVDTSSVSKTQVKPEIMKKMRASILVMGPLLARFGKAEIALPGGCLIGARPIDLHLKNFQKLGIQLEMDGEFLYAKVDQFKPRSLIFDYPSVGATENILMAAVLIPGKTALVNAAIEPEVLDLIAILKKMGAHIEIKPPAIIEIEGVSFLKTVQHTVIYDRLEAGALLLSAAITGGSISLPQANPDHLDVFLLKLEEMGHSINIGKNNTGIIFAATKEPRAVSFRTMPYPGFPTDLQAPLMAALCLAEGKSVVHETVFENRFLHVRELQKMGAQIKIEGDRAIINGVDELYGTAVIATDIRASCALVLAGFAAKGTTSITGVQHWKRGYDGLEQKLINLGGRVALRTMHLFLYMIFIFNNCSINCMEKKGAFVQIGARINKLYSPIKAGNKDMSNDVKKYYGFHLSPLLHSKKGFTIIDDQLEFVAEDIISGSFPAIQYSNLKKANFRKSELCKVDFTDCDLSEADFMHAKFHKVTFKNTRVEGADFSGATGLTEEQIKYLIAGGAVV